MQISDMTLSSFIDNIKKDGGYNHTDTSMHKHPPIYWYMCVDIHTYIQIKTNECWEIQREGNKHSFKETEDIDPGVVTLKTEVIKTTFQRIVI